MFARIGGHFAFADSEAITVTIKRAAGERQKLCVKAFPALKSTKPICLAVVRTNQTLTSNDPTLKFTELKLEALGVEAQGGQKHFGAVIEWQGEGAGLLSISGPQGRLFALGSVAQDSSDPTHIQVTITQFSDESLSQQFDRAVLFGESEPERLHAKTEVWLEEVLAPILQKALAAPEIIAPQK
jgi:hypothetical protein